MYAGVHSVVRVRHHVRGVPGDSRRESLAPAMSIVIGLSTGLMILTVALRVYSRLMLTRNWGADDCKSDEPIQPLVFITNI
jgi:hypothetical protein